VEIQIITIVCFIGGSLLATGVGMLVRNAMLRTAQAHGGGNAEVPASWSPARKLAPATSLVGRIDQALTQVVDQSGLGWGIWSVVLLMVACGGAAAAVALLWTDDLVITCLAMGLGMIALVPMFIVRRAKRIALFQQQLPDVLDLLARAVRAGESLEQAVAMVGDNSAEPMAGEFRRCSKQLEMGLAIPAVMRSLAGRVPLTEVKIFGATLTVHRQTGGNLAVMLERLSIVVRDRLNYRRQLRAVTAAGRMSATLVAAAGPMLFFYLMVFEPEYFGRLTATSLGQMLLATAVVLETVGLIWIWRMLSQSK